LFEISLQFLYNIFVQINVACIQWHETYCILLIQWLSGLWGVSKPFLGQKWVGQKKNSSLTAKPTTQPLVWHSDPGTPLLPVAIILRVMNL